MLVPLVALVAASVVVRAFVSQDAYRNLTVVRSPGDAGVTVSFKEPKGVCKTAVDTQRQFTGWVNVPGEFPTNLFFWFVEAREPTESLTLWLNGGPGASSLIGFFTGVGPCEVIERGLDEYETVAREWSWDRASNMLFIDQPNQVGFSYDTPTEGTLSMYSGHTSAPPRSRDDGSLLSWSLVNGTFSSNNRHNTVNSTEAAAMAVWHALQGFLTTFPQYQPGVSASVGLSLFAQSYGGVYGPVIAETFEAQNQKRLTGELSRDTTLELRLTSLGIVNGYVDMMFQTSALLEFSNRNTYGIKALGDKSTRRALKRFLAPDGCKERLEQCQEAIVQEQSPGVTNYLCRRATRACHWFEDLYSKTGAGFYDIASNSTDIQVPLYFAEYLNQASVQEAIGSPVNFTAMSPLVHSSFRSTGDLARDGNIGRLASLVRKGVRVGLMYGDRDWLCNWFGGEVVSLAIAQRAGGSYATKFLKAGYAPILVNDTYVGGDVRQYGNLSFSRIYQAGHQVSLYQPETAFQVFSRIISGRSVSTGSEVDLALYNTTGPLQSTHTDIALAPPEPTCFVRFLVLTCEKEKLHLAINGGGVVINGVWYSSSEDWPLATTRLSLGEATTTPNSAAD